LAGFKVDFLHGAPPQSSTSLLWTTSVVHDRVKYNCREGSILHIIGRHALFYDVVCSFNLNFKKMMDSSITVHNNCFITYLHKYSFGHKCNYTLIMIMLKLWSVTQRGLAKAVNFKKFDQPNQLTKGIWIKVAHRICSLRNSHSCFALKNTQERSL